MAFAVDANAGSPEGESQLSELYVTREGKVALFNEAGNGRTFNDGGSIELMINCFAEELVEFNQAVADYVTEPTVENRAELVKEWADVQVTLSNFAWFFEFDGEEAFNRVADNNMTKVVNGKLFKREDGKILKPDDYKKPDMTGI